MNHGRHYRFVDFCQQTADSLLVSDKSHSNALVHKKCERELLEITKAIATLCGADIDYYPGYAETFTRIGKERGWPPVTRQRFEAQRGPTGAFLVGSPEEVAEKIIRHSESLGGISRVSFQMDNAGLSHAKLLQAIELIGSRVAPLVNG